MQKTKLAPAALATLTAVLILTSCAGPESYQQKMARYTPKVEGKNLVPEIKTFDFKFAHVSSKKPSRGPASAEQVILEHKKEELEAGPTNKKLYFLSLYTQYESLKNYSTEFVGPSISICPNFHTSLLRHREKVAETSAVSTREKKFSYDAKKFYDEAYIASNPELLLPLSKDETTPRIIDVIRGGKEPASNFVINETVHKALDLHLSKTYSEIRELCDYGVSDNYYIYENLITHIKNNKFDADSSNMNILLKTTIFSNMALMTSLEKQTTEKPLGRSIASVQAEKKKGPYVSEIMTRLNITWAEQYFDFISEK
jgi:hypothetical protein